MDYKERIYVYVDVQAGRTVCICKRSDKKCDKKCHKEIVERDLYRGWQKVMHQNRYGK